MVFLLKNTKRCFRSKIVNAKFVKVILVVKVHFM